MKRLLLFVLLFALVACSASQPRAALTTVTVRAPTLTPFPALQTANIIPIGELTILDRTVTIREDHNVTAVKRGTAEPGSVWIFDFPLWQDPATGDVWCKIASQTYWMAIYYNGRYFTTWKE